MLRLLLSNYTQKIMGESIGNNKYTIKDDGTIVRGRKCPKCGRELISEGDYCEYCGAKIKGETSTSSSKKGCSKAVLWLFLAAIVIVAAIVITTSLTTSNNNYYYDGTEPTVDTTVAEEFYHEASSWDPEEGSYWGDEADYLEEVEPYYEEYDYSEEVVAE